MGISQIVTIDGPSASGKGFLASAVAKELRLTFFSTGIVYRLVAFLSLRSGKLTDLSQIIQKITPQKVVRYLDAPELQSPAVSQYASQIAIIPDVRSSLIKIQKAVVDSYKTSVILVDGRDVGSVIFPHAKLKIFLTASPHIRALRRYKDWQLIDQNMGYFETLQAIQQRDIRDSTRAAAPLTISKGSVVIDTSFMSRQSIVRILAHIIEYKFGLAKKF